MKKLLKVVLSLLLFTSVGAYAATAVPAAPAPAAPSANNTSVKIGVLDLQQIFQQSPLAAKLNKQLQSQFGSRQQQITSLNANLQSEMDQLQKNGAVMDDTSRSKLQDKIIADRASLQAMAQSYQRDYQDAQGQAMQKFIGVLQTAVNKVAQQGKYTVIVLRSATPYFDPSIDVTKQVLKQMPDDNS